VDHVFSGTNQIAVYHLPVGSKVVQIDFRDAIVYVVHNLGSYNLGGSDACSMNAVAIGDSNGGERNHLYSEYIEQPRVSLDCVVVLHTQNFHIERGR
jgi:hypothetical protein